MAKLFREENFKLPKPKTITGSFHFFQPNVGGNGRVYEASVIRKLFENQQKYEEKKDKQPQQPKWKLNPKKERRLRK